MKKIQKEEGCEEKEDGDKKVMKEKRVEEGRERESGRREV